MQATMKQWSWTGAMLSWAIFWSGCGTIPTSQVNVKQLVTDYYALRPTSAVGPQITMAQAQRTQEAFVQALVPRSGPPVGYKVGLVTQAAQQKYGVNAPVRGVLSERMLLESNARVPARFGVNPMCEADLLVVVKDKGINQAQNVLDVAQHLSEVRAFIELPDAVFPTNQPVTGAMLTAVNVGARLGVLGQRRPVQSSPAFVEALATMKITMTDQTGAGLGQGQGKTILDHPLHSVLWLKEELHRAGRKLKPGDMISLGSVSMVTPKPGQIIIVTYEGLPGGPFEAAVSFY
jgi:2-keto-4-pentenoate hydratase